MGERRGNFRAISQAGIAAELPIPIDLEKVAEFCRARGIQKLSLFGSVLRDDFDPARSDVDFLVAFDPVHRLDAFDDYFGLKEGLEALLGRTVDLVVESVIRNPYFRAGIEHARERLYAA